MVFQCFSSGVDFPIAIDPAGPTTSGKAVRCKEPLQLDTVEELEMHKKLRRSAELKPQWWMIEVDDKVDDTTKFLGLSDGLPSSKLT